MTKKIQVAVSQSNSIKDMKFLRGKMGMFTVLILILMKGTDGPPVKTLPNTGPKVIIINACIGEKKLLMIEHEFNQEDILTSQWIFSNGAASNNTNYVTYCKKETSGEFMVNPSFSSIVEQCNSTSILLKNISFHDMGYYKLQFLKEKVGKTESLPIFLSVAETPTKQCKPVIRSHSGNMLNCSTQCEQFDVEWRLNKGEGVVGNDSILLVDCLWKNESILCCLKSKDMECYKGDRFDLCAQITPSDCTENKPGENDHDVHADKAPDNPGSDMFGLLALLALLIIPVITVYVLYRKKILSYPTMCRDTNKSIPNSSVSTHEETVPIFPKDQHQHVDVNDTLVPEKPSPNLETVQELDADVKLDQTQEKTFPILDADDQHNQLQNPVHETEEAGTEQHPNSETTIEIQELRHAAICKVCFTRKMNVLFLPCKHIATCGNCCSAIENCPVCRAKIVEKIENIRYE